MGVDWASQTHHVSVIDAEGREVGERGFTHGGEGLAETAAPPFDRTAGAGELPDRQPTPGSAFPLPTPATRSDSCGHPPHGPSVRSSLTTSVPVIPSAMRSFP